MEELIIARTGCSQQEATIIAADLEALNPELKPHLNAWLKDEAYTFSTEYDGYSMASLERDYGMNFTGAILTLDWLIRESEAAKKALAYGIR